MLSVTGFEPGFISPLENITVAAGRSAQFTCVVKHLGGHKVRFNIFDLISENQYSYHTRAIRPPSLIDRLLE